MDENEKKKCPKCGQYKLYATGRKPWTLATIIVAFLAVAFGVSVAGLDSWAIVILIAGALMVIAMIASPMRECANCGYKIKKHEPQAPLDASKQ